MERMGVDGSGWFWMTLDRVGGKRVVLGGTGWYWVVLDRVYHPLFGVARQFVVHPKACPDNLDLVETEAVRRTTGGDLGGWLARQHLKTGIRRIGHHIRIQLSAGWRSNKQEQVGIPSQSMSHCHCMSVWGGMS